MDNARSIRTFELTVNISGVMDVPFDDWPANMQDAIYEALDHVAEREQLPLAIVHAEYGTDPDLQEGQAGKHYVHVIASEVVAGDERTLTPGRVMREVPEDVRRLLN